MTIAVDASSPACLASVGASGSAPSLRTRVRRALESYTRSRSEEVAVADAYRAFRDEATNLYQTELVRENLRRDPFGRLRESIASEILEGLLCCVGVADYHSVTTKAGYVYTEAAVRIEPDGGGDAATTTKAKKRRRLSDESRKGVKSGERSQLPSPPPGTLRLTFKYERDPGCGPGFLGGKRGPTTVRYAIEMSQNCGPSRLLLWVDVLAAGDAPSHFPARNCLAEAADDEGSHGAEQWDGDDDNEAKEPAIAERKRSRLGSSEEGRKAPANRAPVNGGSRDGLRRQEKPSFSAKAVGEAVPNNDDDETLSESEEDGSLDEGGDRFAAGMDPDVLRAFLEGSHLDRAELDDDVAFFLLMSFPFYESEWDLVGFALDAVFGYDDDSESDGACP